MAYKVDSHVSAGLLVVATLTLSGCATGVATPVTPDECFGGIFWDGDAFTSVTHNDGALAATASPPYGSEWEVMTFSGYSNERGLGSGQATLWWLSDSGREELSFTLEMRLNEGTDCTERDTLSYSFHFVDPSDGSHIGGSFTGRRTPE